MAAEAMAIADVQAIRRRNQRTDDTKSAAPCSMVFTQRPLRPPRQGRIQSFLRAGTDIGDGAPIIGADPKVVRADTPDYDKVIQGYHRCRYARQTRMARGRAKRQEGHERGRGRPISHQSTGGERVQGTGEGSFESRPDGKKKLFRQAKAKMGEVLYVDYRRKASRTRASVRDRQ